MTAIRRFPLSAVSITVATALGLLGNKLADNIPDLPVWLLAGVLVAFMALEFAVDQQRNRKTPNRDDLAVFIERLNRGLRFLYGQNTPAKLIPLVLQNSYSHVRPHRILRGHELPPRDISHETILDAFHSTGERMLVLGNPGSGKSTILCELAQLLLDQESDRPLAPLVFNLTSWTQRPMVGSFETWLVSEMNRAYQIRKDIGKILIGDALVTVILDGLDEVREADRQACVDSINQFLHDYSGPVAVGCRIDEYESIDVGIELSSAVVIKPLSRGQVEAWCAENVLSALTRAYSRHPVLRSLVSTPLWIEIANEALQGLDANRLDPDLDEKELKILLWGAYLSYSLGSKNDLENARQRGQYQSSKLRQWLRWLAITMDGLSLSNLYIEDMQPTLLPERLREFRYVILDRLVVSLMVGLLTALVFGWERGVIMVLYLSLALGMGEYLETWLRHKTSERWAVGLAYGLAFALAMVPLMLAIPLFVYYLEGVWEGMVSPGEFLTTCLAPGLASGLWFGLTAERGAKTQKIDRIDAIEWSWNLSGLRDGVLVSLVVIVGFGLMVGPSVAVAKGARQGLISALYLGAAFGVPIGIAVGVARQCDLPPNIGPIILRAVDG